MRRLWFLLALAACTKGPEADLPHIGQARSLAAEWAMVNEQAAQGRVTGTYARTMRASAREELGTAASSLTQPDTRYAQEIGALLAEPDDAAPEELRAHAEVLKQIEDRLESA